jgi:hypothetical protein
MIIKTKAVATTKKEVSKATLIRNNADHNNIVAFRLTTAQLEQLKAKASAEQRSISNYVKTQLFNQTQL